MADVISPPQAQHLHATAIPHPEKNKPRLPPMSMPVSIPAGRNGQSGLDVFSPVNQNGSFEFDRVLKSGAILKRSRKTKQWKRFYLVLRPNLLSMYRNESEEKLLKQVNLSDLTAVNILKDPKGRRDHMFGLFTPSHNYHFQAGSDAEMRSWVDIIRREAKIDEEEESMIFGSPQVAEPGVQLFSQSPETTLEPSRVTDRLMSSSPEPESALSSAMVPGVQPVFIRRQPTSQPRNSSFNEYDYSGQEQGSYSDFSDGPSQSLPVAGHMAPRTIPLRPTTNRTPSYPGVSATSFPTSFPTSQSLHNVTTTELQQQTTKQQAHQSEPKNDDQRVLWQGHLLVLKSKGGVRQWKRLWAVLRPAHLAFYKNKEEYSTHLLLPLSSILSAIEIDPLSRSKAYCMQIISEDRTYRFCAENEDQLARCLGAVKSLLARRKGINASSGGAATTGAPQPLS